MKGAVIAKTEKYVRGADDAVLYITMATDIQVPYGGRHCADALKAAEQDMKAAYAQTWDTIRADSLKAHNNLYGRSVFSLEDSEPKATTPERLRAMDSGARDILHK
jgi:hypothetical protein